MVRVFFLLLRNMLMGLVGLLILLVVSIIYGTLAFPTQDDLILVLSSSMLLVMAWLYRREKRTISEEKKDVKEEK